MSRELLKECLNYLIEVNNKTFGEYETLIDKLSTELAKPDPEPVAWALFSKELMPTGAAYAIRRVEIQLAQIESDLDIQDAKIRPLYAEPVDQSARIAELEAELDQAYKIVDENWVSHQQLAALQTKRDPEAVAFITGWYGGYQTINVIDGAVLPNGTPLYAVPPNIQKRKPLSDEQILNIASNPLITPCSPWWLKDDVAAGDVQNAAKAFARAIETAHGITS